MENYNKKSIWKWILLYVVIAAVTYGTIYYFFYNKGGYSENSQYPITNFQNEITDWKTYKNDEHGFEFKYPQSVVVKNQGQNIVNIADTTDGYTINWSLKLYKNNSSQSLANWFKSEFSQFKNADNKDCKVFKSDAYGPKVEIKNTFTVLVTQTSDFNESCIDQGYYVISPNNLIIVKFEDITQASPGHLQEIVSTFKFTK